MHETTDLTCIILAAGKGTRMKSNIHKMMHKIGGMPLVGHVLNLCQNKMNAKNIVVVIDPDEAATTQYIADNSSAKLAKQAKKLGTGHAVLMAKTQIQQAASKAPDGIILVLYADTPFVQPDTLNVMIDKIKAGDDLVVLGFTPKDPAQYGRLLTDKDDDLTAIREYKDATDTERKVRLCNSGIMAFRAKHLLDLLTKIDNKNASGEYYLTDCVEIANSLSLKVTASHCAEIETLGINDRVQLAQAETIYQNQLREAAMRDGVTLIDPLSVYLSAHAHIEADVTIEPNVVINGYVSIKQGANILAFSHISGTKSNPITIGQNANIGPYARLREGSEIGNKAKIGNFVETKKTIIKDGAKVNHLSYIGDAIIGEKANIGAGTITCNYDGFNKFQTIIGKGAFVGSNSSLVAPLNIADGSYIGSGSVVTNDVSANALALTRAQQIEITDWASRFRDKNTK
ncbi:MAG: bifunctional UDP-N-acetylglucosamine diphosphorylase/glucosamine-1-phosphate N-acetyltransferase GlmU [Rhizobiales bacterium]|nr:bifunctional UDP-N-acetylglucosamine diphosphorylase/glucosamine-1-phosphate N-acetyltransferase GlmU [Hyphomicrobiales bacterium]NRB14806.1 bifunctional UDP-N-acetylglucosamine diphosphorylase/glucosamine-1-phosphate N-acetyltransferase GlmU [Hyphomicrobiales bacterium]